MIQEDESGNLRYIVPYHYESAAKTAGERASAGRMRRLAQEAATLVNSLPLSTSSSVFVRCDSSRLDVMKVRVHELFTKKLYAAKLVLSADEPC